MNQRLQVGMNKNNNDKLYRRCFEYCLYACLVKEINFSLFACDSKMTIATHGTTPYALGGSHYGVEVLLQLRY